MRWGTGFAVISSFLVWVRGVCVWVRAVRLTRMFGYGFCANPAFGGKGLRSVFGYEC